ncbi:MAG: outer membrane protein [Geminicoccales bacterium]
MKRSALTCGLLTSLFPLVLGANGASAQSVGDLYWGVFGGAQFYNENDVNDDEIEFDPGFAVGGQIGYIFGSVRAEAEIEYNESDVDEIDGRNSGSTLEVIRGTGGLYFDFIGFNQSNILPYVGGGFGFAGLELGSDDDTALTAHGEAGVSFAASNNFDIVFSYRFEWYDTDVGGVDDDVTAHQVRAGIRFFQ